MESNGKDLTNSYADKLYIYIRALEQEIAFPIYPY